MSAGACGVRVSAGRLRLGAISDYLVEKDTLVWADIYDPDHEASKELARSSASTTGPSRTPSPTRSEPRPRSTRRMPSSRCMRASVDDVEDVKEWTTTSG